MRNNAIDFENLKTQPGLTCLWASTGEAEAAHLTAHWISSQEETLERASAPTVSTLSTSTFSTFDAFGQFFAENSATYDSPRLEWVLPVSQV